MSQFNHAITLTDSTKSIQPKLRLDYLDGIRGIAALYVVFCHICFDAREHFQIAEVNYIVKNIIYLATSHGQTAVAIFIVLSGYCLMLPIARSISGELKGGIKNYFKRRALRILPPYYIALLLSLFLHAVISPNILPLTGAMWMSGHPALNLDAVISHLFLIHNFVHSLEYRINPPMWSVAAEWQIYFLFPLVLLPIWRRFGLHHILIVACGIALILYKLEIHSWYIILFSMGMVGAIIGFSQESTSLLYKENVPWDRLALFFGVLWLVTVPYPVKPIFNDLLIGFFLVCLMISSSQLLTKNRLNIALNILGSHWAIILGSFSYSLYLTHALVLAIIEVCLSTLQIQSPTLFFMLLVSTILPASIVFAYLFYLVFEKPFIGIRDKYIYKKSIT